MIHIESETFVNTWGVLGLGFFDDALGYWIEFKNADRMFYSFDNTFIIHHWDPEEFEGKALYEITGYSSRKKLENLRRVYLNEDRWKKFLATIQERRHIKFSCVGMNFEMEPIKKGGCLSSIHWCKVGKEETVYLTSKIVEVPRRLVADALFFNELLKDIGKVKVVWKSTALYFSILSLRAYIPVFGENQLKGNNLRELPILGHRNYQRSTQENIEKYQRVMEKKYGKFIWKRGLWEKISKVTGNWEK